VIHSLVHWAVSALALMLTAYLVKGFKISSFVSALLTALVIGFVSMMVRPLLLFLALPLNVLTLGLFTFVVDGVILKLCAAVMPGFKIEGWASAIFGAFVLALSGALLHGLLV
jgi:putative membrane protein